MSSMKKVRHGGSATSRLLYGLVGGALALGLLTGAGRDDGPARILPTYLPFAKGERLQYAVKVLGTDAGRAQLDVASVRTVDGQPVFSLRGTADTNGFFDNVFPLHNRGAVVWNPYKPWAEKLQYDFEQARKRFTASLRFDDKKLRIVGKRAFEGAKKKVNDPAPRGSLDAISFTYFLRTLDLKPKMIVRQLIHSGRRLYVITARVGKKQSVWTPVATYEAWVINAEIRRADNSRPDWKQALTFYVEDGRHRLLARVDLDSPVGKVVAQLDGIRLPKLTTEGDTKLPPRLAPTDAPAADGRTPGK